MTESIRLLFRYRGDEMVVHSMRRIRMRAPIEDRQRATTGIAGRFVELRSEDGRVIYRRLITGEAPRMVEYPTGDPQRPFARVAPPPGAIFSIVVPLVDRASQAVIVDVEAAAADGGAVSRTSGLAARDVVTVGLGSKEVGP